MCPLIDFYLLYCNPLVFSPDRLLAAYKKGLDCDTNVDTYKEFCGTYNHPALNGEQAMLFSAEGVVSVNEIRDRVRNGSLQRISKETVQKILKGYKEVDSTNSLDGKGPIYPKGLSDIFMTNKGLHLLLDEFAHMVYMILHEEVKIAPNSMEKAKRLREMFATLHDSYGTLINPERKTKLDKPESYGLDLDNQALYQCVSSFWRTWGLHMPCNLSAEFDERIAVGAGEDDPYSKDLVDVDTHIMDDLDNYDNCPCMVSDSAKAEVRAYMKAHGGRLPDDW
jgi:hypothetical protein